MRAHPPISSIAITLTAALCSLAPKAIAAPNWLSTSPPPASRPTAQAPAITAGHLLTTALDVTKPLASPRINFSFSAPNHFLEAGFIVTSPSGKMIYPSYQSLIPHLTAGSITVQDSTSDLGMYAQPGTYTITSASVLDAQLQRTNYTGAQLAALFPSLTFQVINPGTPDITPPAVVSGRVITPTVSLSKLPFFQASLTLTDDVSGLGVTLIEVSPPASKNGFEGQSSPPHPLLSGKLQPAVYLGQSVPLGIWTIDAYWACDIAANCTTSTSEAEIKKLFGISHFRVVQ